MKKIIFSEWLFATATIVAIIIGLERYEPERYNNLVNSLASYVKQALQILG